MKEFGRDELKGILLDSYELILKLPQPNKERGTTKYQIASRSKLKSLPEALREFEDPAAAITHLVKSAAYFLPRSDGSGPKGAFEEFLPKFLEIVRRYSESHRDDPAMARQKLEYLIGYMNWSADSICVLLTVANGERARFSESLGKMLEAEFGILGLQRSELEDLCKKLTEWALLKKIEDRRG